MIYNSRGQEYSRISFRSDDDNDDVLPSNTFTQLRRYDFSSTFILHYPYALSSFSQHNNNNSYRFFYHPMNAVYIYMYARVFVRVCISGDRKNVPCFTEIDGRLVDPTHILVYV